MRTIPLRSGSRMFTLGVPSRNLMTVAEPTDNAASADLPTELRRALREPIGAVSFSEIIREGERLLILVDDLTRATPVAEILPILLEELAVEQKRVKVTILIALGTHRKMTSAEIENRVGIEIARRYRVLNHDWEDETALVNLGTTRNGTPLLVNRLIQEADHCLGVGCILPHDLAGWSGGAKIVQPGICGKVTTNRTHLLAAHNVTTYLGTRTNPLATGDRGDGTAREPDRDHQCCAFNRHGKSAFVVAGDTVAAHRRGSNWHTPFGPCQFRLLQISWWSVLTPKRSTSGRQTWVSKLPNVS